MTTYHGESMCIYCISLAAVLSELYFSKSLGGCGGANRYCDTATAVAIAAAVFAAVQQEAAHCLLLSFYLVGPPLATAVMSRSVLRKPTD